MPALCSSRNTAASADVRLPGAKYSNLKRRNLAINVCDPGTTELPVAQILPNQRRASGPERHQTQKAILVWKHKYTEAQYISAVVNGRIPHHETPARHAAAH